MQQAYENTLITLNDIKPDTNQSKKIVNARQKLFVYEDYFGSGIKDAGKYLGENHIVKITLDVENKARLGNSMFSNLVDDSFDDSPDFNNRSLNKLLKLLEKLKEKKLIRSLKCIGNGGIVTSLSEMAILGDSGISAHLTSYDFFEQAFNEEIAVLLEIDRREYDEFLKVAFPFSCKWTHPYPNSQRVCVKSKHYHFNIRTIGLTNKKKKIDIWWGLKCSNNLNYSTDTVKNWYER